jgi:uncharacterized protein YcbX
MRLEKIMSNAAVRRDGFVAQLWRYPVKSMRGEQIEASEVTDRGLLGDRFFALVDEDSGKIISAKNPRKWPDMFDFRSELVRPPRLAESLPPARITFPDGASARTDEVNIDEQLSGGLGTEVRLAQSVPEDARIEGYWPNYPWLPVPDDLFEMNLAPGMFFDGAPVHLMTTASLECLRSLCPQSRFEPPRFRPNIVVETSGDSSGFVENDWVGRVVLIGNAVRLQITEPCARCVMTTLAQGDLPKDPNVLRTIVKHNQGNLGVLATVVEGGRMNQGDAVRLE